jgi:hypothetical protein
MAAAVAIAGLEMGFSEHTLGFRQNPTGTNRHGEPDREGRFVYFRGHSL